MDPTFLRPLLAGRGSTVNRAPTRDYLFRALDVDEALKGRFRVDETGDVVLTGPAGSPPPLSVKERRRWELHVRLRLAAEFGSAVEASVRLRWLGSQICC